MMQPYTFDNGGTELQASRVSIISSTLGLTALSFASLWDFRLYEVRLFDGIALMIVAASFATCGLAVSEFVRQRQNYWPFFCVFILNAAWSYALHSHHSSLAIIILAVLGFSLIGHRRWLTWEATAIWALVVAHIVFMLTLRIRVANSILPPAAGDTVLRRV